MRLILKFFRKIYNSKRFLIIFIFLASVLCSLIFLIFLKNVGPHEHRVLSGSDYLVYYKPIANSILQGKGITLRGNYLFAIAPGFPIILSGVFAVSQLTGIDELSLIVVLNIILTAVSSCLLFFIAKEIFNKKIALITSFLWMSYPFNLWFIKNPNTEVPFIPLLFAGILFYILTLKRKKLRFAFLGGLFLGLASTVRLIGLFLPFFLTLLIFFFLRVALRKKRFLLIVILLIGNLIAISPWAIYSFSKTGSFIPLSSHGPKSMVSGITWLSRSNHPVVVSDDVGKLIERVRNGDLTSFSKFFQFFSQELINRPIPVLKLIGLKLIRSWYATSEQWWEGKILAVQLLYIITGFLGLLYGIRAVKDKIRNLILVLMSIIIYFWGMAFLNVSILRYMVPVMSLVIIFSAIAVNIVIDKLVKKFRLCSLCQF